MIVALAGNPNSGKTTLFNVLTGSTAHVGNWPGVTVDKRTGTYKKHEKKVEIVDLPGIYSLSPYTPEEVVARNFLIKDKPDCIINIVDATNFERNLYLTTQLLELDIPVVVALNFIDAMDKSGDTIDVKALQKALGVPVAKISALRNSGIADLMSKCIQAAKEKRVGNSIVENLPLYSEVYDKYKALNVQDAAFRAVKLIENDEIEIKEFADIHKSVSEKKKGIDTGIFEGDFAGIIADARYKYIEKNLSITLTKATSTSVSRTEKIDRVLTHKVWGIPLFLAIMLAVFHITFSENFLYLGVFIKEGAFDIPVIGTDAINSPGVMLFGVMELFTGWLGELVAGGMAEGTWYTSLVVDGVLSGVFAVLSFVPQIMVLFLFLSILEDSGYMARVAFIMDRAFKKFGLSGKALMPLIMCFGCAVPGIMATRTLEDENERKRSIFLAPFFSCGAKLPIWAGFAGVFSSVFAGMNAELVVFSMYFLGIAVAVIAAFLLKKTILKGETAPLVMELPAYRAPKPKNTAIHLWQKLKHYIFRAATVIAGAVVVIWFLSSFSFTFEFVDDSGDSIIGVISKGLRYIFIPLGFGMGEDGYKFVVAAITGLIAKEMVVATLGTFAGLADDPLEMESSDLVATPLGLLMVAIGGSIAGVNISVAAMFSFMAFNLLSVPCMAAVAAARGELKKGKTLWTAVAFWVLTAYVVSMVVFWVGVVITIMPLLSLIVGISLVIVITLLIVAKTKKLLFFKEKK